MNKQRAAEISSLPEMVNVTYNGQAVYIENVNPNKDCASIHYLNRPAFSQEVACNKLVESDEEKSIH